MGAFKKITTKEAAQALGCSVETVQIGLRKNRFEWGTALKEYSKNWNYIIYPESFKRLVAGYDFREKRTE